MQSAFRKKALEFHPDHNQNNSGKYSIKAPLFTILYEQILYRSTDGFVKQLKYLFLDAAMAEAKFKEVVASYEAIQFERKRGAC